MLTRLTRGLVAVGLTLDHRRLRHRPGRGYRRRLR